MITNTNRSYLQCFKEHLKLKYRRNFDKGGSRQQHTHGKWVRFPFYYIEKETHFTSTVEAFSHLQCCSTGTVAVSVKSVLTHSRTELQQFFTLQLISCKSGQQLEEGTTWNSRNV